MNAFEILSKLPLFQNGARLFPGKLLVESAKVSSPQEVIWRIRDFDGEGWLCSTDQPEIRQYKDNSGLQDLPENVWPLFSENCKGTKSLHVCRAQGGWIVASIEKIALEEAGQDILEEKFLLVKNQQGRLVYEVYWAPVETEGLLELRPRLYRFAGFERKDAP